MAKRKGIGATTASAVIFSILLLSNLALYVASQDRARLYVQADAENSLSDDAIALEGAGGANILEEIQALLGSEILSCPVATEVVAAQVGALSDLQKVQDLTVSTSAEVGSGVPAKDNLTMLAPFNGSIPGELDVSLRAAASGREGPTGILFSKNETHFVHLPLRLGGAVAQCRSAVRGIAEAVSSTSPFNCTTSAIAPLMASADQSAASNATSQGYELGLAYSIAATAPCTVSYQVSIEQQGIQGPTGFFSVQLEEGGSASFEQRPSPPPE